MYVYVHIVYIYVHTYGTPLNIYVYCICTSIRMYVHVFNINGYLQTIRQSEVISVQSKVVYYKHIQTKQDYDTYQFIW